MQTEKEIFQSFSALKKIILETVMEEVIPHRETHLICFIAKFEFECRDKSFLIALFGHLELS